MGRYLCILFCLFSVSFAAEVKLQWNANPDADLAGYRLYYGRTSGSYASKVDVGKVTSYTVNGLEDNVEYFFALSAYDLAGNESARCPEISGVVGDKQPPQLLAVQVLGVSDLAITFSEPLQRASAENTTNYTIEPRLGIQSARLQVDRKTVLLSTDPHQPGVNYTLKVQNIRDIAIPANVIGAGALLNYRLPLEGTDNTPPTILLARLQSATRLQIIFSEPLEETSAVDIKNYYIDQGIAISRAELEASGNIVQLTTSEHRAGLTYTLTVNNVRDRSIQQNAILPNSYYLYTYEPVDLVGPLITVMQTVDADLVDVMFNEPLDKASAENPANYSIHSDVQVLSASLDASGQVVHLRTSAHVTNRLYVMNVRGVCDASPQKNMVAPGTSYAYVFVPLDNLGPTISQVQVKDATHLSVVFNEPVDRISAERVDHYRINNDVQVLNASLESNGRVVVLETTMHIQGRLYLLVVNQVIDASPIGNEILPNSSYAYVYGAENAHIGPTIVKVEVQSATSLKVYFSKPLEKTSAENVTNYRLNRDTAVLSATLDASATCVSLETTPHEANRLYILTVSNVTDASIYHNIIIPNSAYSYIFEGTDVLGPLITLVKVVDARRLDVLFNEKVDKESAETVSNYVISSNITVLSAQLDGSRRLVQLQTTVHVPQNLYLLRINGVKDENSNVIAPNSSYTYLYEPMDALPPTLAMVRVKDPQHIEVSFSEKVESVSATTKGNYALTPGVEILAVKASTAPNQVELEVTPLLPGKIYILLVNNIRDEVGNVIVPNSAYAFTYGNPMAEPLPMVTAVKLFNPTSMEITFNMPVEKGAAETVSNYNVEGITIHSARLDPSGMKVTLNTSPHKSGCIYVLMVNQIYRQGRPDLMILSNTPYFYMLPESEETAPTVVKVEASGETMVDVYFSKPVDEVTAENRRNYLITNDVVVLFANLDDSGMRVTLETSRHKTGQVYTLSVFGVRSRNGSATINSSVTAYTYVPGLQVKIEGNAECLMSSLEIGRPYYVDRNYIITQAPAALLRAKMLMTANNDKSRSDARFLVMQLNQATIVYIAYDANAISVPNWLKYLLTLTSQRISVSESSAQLALWAAYFPAGRVELGGNDAAGAEGAKCMYIVLFQEPAFAQILSAGELESLQEKS